MGKTQIGRLNGLIPVLYNSNFTLAVPTLILAVGVYEDIRTQKVRNQVVIACAVAALIQVLLVDGVSGIPASLLSLFGAFLVCFPLAFFKIIGAGDVKLFMAFAIAVDFPSVIFVGVASLFWAAGLGILQALFKGDLKKLLSNTFHIGSARTVSTIDLHRIPYTVALFMAWLTHLTLTHTGERWL